MSTKRRGATSTDDSAADTPPSEFTQRGGGRTKKGGLQSPTEPATLGSPPAVQPNLSILATAKDSPRMRRSGRHAENETNQCPYCDYTDPHNFSMLAHVRNEHPGLKWIKKEVDSEAPRAPIVEALHESDVAGPSSPPPQQQPPQTPRAKGRKAKVIETLPASPPQEEPPPKKRGRQPKKPEIDFMNVEDVVAEEIINTVEEEEIIIPDELDDPGATYTIIETAEMKETTIPMVKRRQIHELPPDDESDKKHMSHQILRSPIRGPLPRRPHDAVLLDPQVAMPNLDVSVDKSSYEGVSIRDSLQRTYMEEQILSENDEYIEEPPHLDKNLRQGPRGTYARTYDSMMNLDVEVQIDEVEYSSGAEFDEIDVEGQHDELYEDNKHLMYRSQMGQNIPRTRPSRHNPLGDPNGRYPCYIDGCKWRGNFRSVRCTHMRNVHPDWVRPPRFVLNRISRDGHVLPANDANARYSCFIDGCPWRGNYRASRSNHMKTQHKGWVPKRTRAKNGGFVENGRYHCHVEECGWRGMSRSTRAVHMRREHPGFVNPIYTPRNIPCTDCGSSMTSHKLFVDHMVVEHKIGGIVQREFTDARDYEDWFEAVQESFSIDFIKKMGVKNGPNYQILYLYCARSGGYCPARGYDKKLDPMGLYEPRHAKHFRRRDKCGRNCAAFLRVMHWNDGRLSIIGCVEHTGHRLGTALLRLSPIEREAMDEYLYMMEENTPLDLIIDRLREIEGLSAAGYEPRLRPVDFVRQFVMDGDERKSLNVLLNNLEFFPEDSSFGIVPPPEDQYALSVGWMDSQMKELWKEYAHKGVCLEEVRLMLGEWDLRVMLVIVLDMNQNPRIAALYISNSSDKRPLMDHITSIWSGEVATFVTDYSSEYPDLLERYFGHFSEGELDLQFAEWHLLSEWAATIDQLVINRVDKYGIICVLRRLLRTTDSNVFDQTINELFDGLREMQLDEVAQYVDDQLDPIFLKRWSPSGRNPLTEHNNPTLEFACRMLRERFISCEQCTRIDEYVGFLIQRIREFNESELSAIYATRESDPPRELPQHYMELALEECELGGSVVRHELDDEEGEAWADFGQRANGIQGIHPRFNQIDLSYDKSRIVDMEASGSEQNGVKPPGMEELVEEIVEEEVVPFEQAELLNQMVQEGEFVGDDEDYSQSSGGRPEGKRQRLLNMMSALQHRLEHLADDECIELVEGSIEQVVNKLQTATPKK